MQKLLIIFLASLLFVSCNSNSDKRPETALDTGRDFIRASLDGDFKKAENLLLKDSQNLQLFDRYKNYYKNLPEEKKQQYKTAEYNINKLTDVNDSTTTINYSNSYMKEPMDIKVVRTNKEWGVDFKYTYAANNTITE